MENKDSGPSLFETIGFKYNDCLMVLDVLNLVGTDMPDDCKNPEGIIRKFIKQGYWVLATLFLSPFILVFLKIRGST